MGEYPGKKMMPMLALIDAREVVEFEDYIRHPGQEFALVLSGKVRIQFENGDRLFRQRHRPCLPVAEQETGRGAGRVQRPGRSALAPQARAAQALRPPASFLPRATPAWRLVRVPPARRGRRHAHRRSPLREIP